MSDKLKLPLNHQAVTKADDQFYAAHPELIQNGQRIPLSATDPAQANLRREWVKLYQANNGAVDDSTPTNKTVDAPTQDCPFCPPDKGLLVVNVVDEQGNPVVSALVTADGMQRFTDQQGIADFGAVDAKTYKIAASKPDYRPFGPYDDNVVVAPQEKNTGTQGLTSCIASQLKKRFLIARTASNITSFGKIPIAGSAGGPLTLDFGQDITFSTGMEQPSGDSVSDDETELKSWMRLLPQLGFAADDPDGNAQRMFDKFLEKQKSIILYTDPNIDKKVATAENFVAFSDRTLAAPGTEGTAAGKIRIHQALQNANWDINQVTPITDLGNLAFNAGSKYSQSGDYGNGLFVMFHGIDYVLVFVDKYAYDACKQQYTISLIFELYDVFGLDDDDLDSYGTKHSWAKAPIPGGITAWWQLQHQFNYAPLVTKVVVTRDFTVSTTP